jgi:RNA recognition motif-containing protein
MFFPQTVIDSRYGEVMDINMPRDPETGKPKGFCFLMYEDQRSTVLAVDNMTGAQVLGRTIRVSETKRIAESRALISGGPLQEVRAKRH